jgi:hypothetical protein
VRHDVLPGLDAEVLLALRVERQHHAEDLINSLTETKKGKRKK